MNIVSREEVESLLKIKIRKLSLYQEALTHKSAVKMYNTNRSNETLEFIGDAVLNLIVAIYLFENYPNENEGFLTKLRTKIVNGKNLAYLAESIQLQNHIRMNTKAINQKWNENTRILEDTFEAIIGAIYLDTGLYHAKLFILDKISNHINMNSLLDDNNYKDKLMKHCHNQGFELPEYKLVSESGPNHNKSFTIHVIVEGDVIGQGIDKNKKEAEQRAAYNALEYFK
tara:strand:+ start:397 stop:1080 length:684 start_codon:yes stop_codon:yes gene_type:complete